jgi:hypothetical protein
MVRTRTANRNAEAANREPASQTIIPPEQEQETTRAAEPARTAPVSTRQPAPAQASHASGGSTGVATVEQRALAPVNQRNAFEAYGQQMSMTSITGTLIKFNKGDWVTGDDEDLEEDLELVANMDELMCGWIKWVDQRPSEQIMGRVADGYQALRRSELGDLDQNNWEVDEQGRPRDPWQFSNYIVMKDPGQSASEDFLYTFATSSKGGLGAIGAMCREYGREMRVRPDEFPIVRLGGDSYVHRVYGRTKVPTLDIVGWEPKAQFAATAEVRTVSNTNAREEPSPAQAQPAQTQAAAGGSRRRR